MSGFGMSAPAADEVWRVISMTEAVVLSCEFIKADMNYLALVHLPHNGKKVRIRIPYKAEIGDSIKIRGW